MHAQSMPIDSSVLAMALARGAPPPLPQLQHKVHQA